MSDKSINVLKDIIGPIAKLFEPLSKELVEANRENIKETFGPITFRVKKPNDIKDVIKHLKESLGKNDNISGDDISGEFHVGFTQGRYEVKGEDVHITITDKWIFDTYPEISSAIRDIIDNATNMIK